MTRTTIPTDRNHPYWQGYQQCLSNVRMMMFDLSLVGDDEQLEEKVVELIEYIESTCGTAVMLANVRNRSPEYRRKQIRVVK